jgi:hypothetical protein
MQMILGEIFQYKYNSIINMKSITINLFKLKIMKIIKISSFYAVLTIAVLGCSSDDAPPEFNNVEELITTVVLTLTPENGEGIELKTVDLDGEGPNDPVITVSGSFTANTSYQGAVLFLNQSVTPEENITEEVIEEADEHQVFYTTTEGLNIETQYEDQDSQGNPLGVQITLFTGLASAGTLTVTLRHEPLKPNDGLDSAGGETDITTRFDVSIQ